MQSPPITQSMLIQWIVPAITTIVVGSLAWSVNKLSENFQRIDTYMAKTDASYQVMRNQLDATKSTLAAQDILITNTREMTLKNQWAIDEIQRETAKTRR